MIEGGLGQPGSARRARAARRRKHRILGALVALAALAGAAYFGRDLLGPAQELAAELAGSEAPPEAEPAAPALPAPPAPAEPEAEPAPPTEPLPPPGESDAFARERAAGLSARPEFARWLLGEELVHRFVAAVDAVAHGESPRDSLRELAPQGPFRTSERGGRLFVDPSSWSRYDVATAVFASLDAEACARLHRQLLPLFEAAYAELGRSEGRFDDALARAFRELLGTPVRDGEPELVPGVRSHDFADPGVEALSPAQKHLLRMGPTNARRIQAKLRELAPALDLYLSQEALPGGRS